MSKVLIHASMSLDGYVAGTNISTETPMGDNGERLHEWMFTTPGDPRDRAVTESIHAETGAVVLGRRTFDVGIGLWGDVPYPVPCFVVTHEVKPDLPQRNGTFSFVPSVALAVSRAKTAAGNRTVTLMGAAISHQALAEGLVDELSISVVPILLGAGTRLFDALPAATFTGPVTHIRAAL